MIFKKSDNALSFWLIIYDFFLKYDRPGVLINQKLEINMPQIFKTKIGFGLVLCNLSRILLKSSWNLSIVKEIIFTLKFLEDELKDINCKFYVYLPPLNYLIR